MLSSFACLISCILVLQARGGSSSGPATHAVDWRRNEWGELLLCNFKSAPFPHSSREKGYQSQSDFYDPVTHYSDSTVGIFIPTGYQPQESIDFVVHFHGHRTNVATVLEQFDLCRELHDSGVNAILIVPQGPKNAPDSGCGKLEHDPGAMKALLEEVMQYLNLQQKAGSTRLGRVVLSAHSGGYKVTGAVLKNGGISDHVTDVLLFDATYGQLEAFTEFCAGDRERRLISIFTDHLAGENFELITRLNNAGVPYHAVMENDLTAELLKSRGPLLISTTELQHNEVISKRHYFGRFVGSSRLDRIKPPGDRK